MYNWQIWLAIISGEDIRVILVFWFLRLWLEDNSGKVHSIRGKIHEEEEKSIYVYNLYIQQQRNMAVEILAMGNVNLK
jgi:hypothetical protein